MILDVCMVSGASVAKARDDHYHNPPYYLVLEPEDTSKRTRNLRQTNTVGYVWQDTQQQRAEAESIVESWGVGRLYDCHPDYQALLRELLSKFRYRLDTNFAKMDRIRHAKIEEFKTRILNLDFCGMAIGEWARLIGTPADGRLQSALAKLLDLDVTE